MFFAFLGPFLGAGQGGAALEIQDVKRNTANRKPTVTETTSGIKKRKNSESKVCTEVNKWPRKP